MSNVIHGVQFIIESQVISDEICNNLISKYGLSNITESIVIQVDYGENVDEVFCGLYLVNQDHYDIFLSDKYNNYMHIKLTKPLNNGNMYSANASIIATLEEQAFHCNINYNFYENATNMINGIKFYNFFNNLPF